MFLFVCGVLCLERWNWDVGKEKKKKTFNFFFLSFWLRKCFWVRFALNKDEMKPSTSRKVEKATLKRKYWQAPYPPLFSFSVVVLCHTDVKGSKHRERETGGERG